MAKPPRRTAETPRACQVCGGNWFREGDFYEFFREDQIGNSWPTWPKLVGQKSPGALVVGICLCGSPWRPSIGGMHWERTPNRLVSEFMRSLEAAGKVNDYSVISAAAPQRWPREKEYAVLRHRIHALERAIAQHKRPGPGRPWSLPRRPAASKGRDKMVLAVEQRGFTARQAKKAVSAFWEAMKTGLREDSLG